MDHGTSGLAAPSDHEAVLRLGQDVQNVQDDRSQQLGSICRYESRLKHYYDAIESVYIFLVQTSRVIKKAREV